MAEAVVINFRSNVPLAIQGGLKLQRLKPGLPTTGRIACLPVPENLTIPLLSYQQQELTPLVDVGQVVCRGETLAPGIVSPASGRVTQIAPQNIIHPSQGCSLCISLATSPTEYSSTEFDEQPVHKPLATLTTERLEQCGIVGLGGAGFSTSEKIAKNTVDTLIINAVECEPLISCDESLLLCKADDVIRAVAAMIELTQCRHCVLAIENDKSEAIKALRKALSSIKLKEKPKLELSTLSPIYPSGAERQLIYRITGIKIQQPLRPSQQGIVCLNVATVYAAWRAMLGYPLDSRIVTIAGNKAKNPCNVRVRLGTSVTDVLKYTNNLPDNAMRVRAGGPLSGFELTNYTAPVSATINCITLDARNTIQRAQPCIRCGACSTACPAGLLPQQLHWYAGSDDIDGAQRFGLEECIECGCCDLVCPSFIHLTQTFRYAKSVVKEKNKQAEAASLAQQRFQSREKRLARLKLADEKKRQEAQKALADGPDSIAAALKQARERKRRARSGKPS